MEPTYLTNFTNHEDIEKEYDVKLDKNIEILIAWYGYGSYDGDSFVLFKQDGKLFEVNGSHCSCYGLEGQWKPEETTVKSLEAILEKGEKFSGGYTNGENECGAVLRKAIDQLKSNV